MTLVLETWADVMFALFAGTAPLYLLCNKQLGAINSILLLVLLSLRPVEYFCPNTKEALLSLLCLRCGPACMCRAFCISADRRLTLAREYWLYIQSYSTYGIQHLLQPPVYPVLCRLQYSVRSTL